MRRNFSPLFLAVCLFALSCGTKENSSGKSDSLEVAGRQSAPSASDSPTDPDPTDTIPSNDYEPRSTDLAGAEKLKAVLPEILKKQLVGADSSARRFVLYEIDLNGDAEPESFIGLTGMNWCGSGGCTALLLSSKGELITYFTVAGFPFIVLEGKTKGWNDLVVHSGGADRLLQWDGKSYPSNPSVAPRFTGTPGQGAPRALDLLNRPYPSYRF